MADSKWEDYHNDLERIEGYAKPIWWRTSLSNIVILIVVAAIPVTYALISYQQDIRQRAQEVNKSSPTTLSPIAVTSPSAGSLVNSKSTVSIQAASPDTNGIVRVEFYINGVITCSDASSPYECSWTVPETKGEIYTITAKAFDSTGNFSTSAISVTSY